jgi:alanyl-tRNA synthetase
MGVKIDGETAFFIYETYGFPIEMILEELSSSDINDKGDLTEKERSQIIADFEKMRDEHRAQSRSGAEQKFKGGLADHSEATTRLHTAHHLLLAALQKVLGPHVHQKGSNITGERLRMDFSHSDKLTPEQLGEVEKIVNEVISRGYPVEKKMMPKAEAEELGAEMEFGQKYGDLVNVYLIRNPDNDDVFSKEFCGGPHVENTSELAKSGKFRIIKEESSGAGIRRIKAVLNDANT